MQLIVLHLVCHPSKFKSTQTTLNTITSATMMMYLCVKAFVCLYSALKNRHEFQTAKDVQNVVKEYVIYYIYHFLSKIKHHYLSALINQSKTKFSSPIQSFSAKGGCLLILSKHFVLFVG